VSDHITAIHERDLQAVTSNVPASLLLVDKIVAYYICRILETGITRSRTVFKALYAMSVRP